jgi:hypothetical protein
MPEKADVMESVGWRGGQLIQSSSTPLNAELDECAVTLHCDCRLITQKHFLKKAFEKYYDYVIELENSSQI